MSSYFHKCSRILGLFTLVVWCCPSLAQTFIYVEPDNPACPVIAVPPAAPPKKVAIGENVAGAIKVGCSFKEGSYTVTLSATDPSAIFSRRSLPIWVVLRCGVGLRALPILLMSHALSC
jgi:hypothetical protein